MEKLQLLCLYTFMAQEAFDPCGIGDSRSPQAFQSSVWAGLEQSPSPNNPNSTFSVAFLFSVR
jgi:hypothetical protein